MKHFISNKAVAMLLLCGSLIFTSCNGLLGGDEEQPIPPKPKPVKSSSMNQ